MISCGNCGFQNESGDAFCGSCGTYLEWASAPAKPVAVAASASAGTGAARGGVALAEPPAEVRRAAQVEAETAARQEEAAKRAAEQATRAKVEAEAKAEAEATARAKAEAEARAKAEEDRRAQEELKRRATEEAEARRRAEEEVKQIKSAADQARAEAALERRRQAEARIRQEAEARAKEAAAAKVQADAEARRRAEAEAKARREAERQRQQAQEARARAEAAEARAATARAAMLVAPEPAVTERPPEVIQDPAGKERPPAPTGKPAEVDLTDGGTAAAPTVAARQPEAIKPTAIKRPPPVAKAPPTTEPQMGDLICDQCSEGNLRSRKFCRRCGASLFEAEPYVPPSVAAGERPMLRGGSRSRPKKLLDFARRYARILVALLGVLILLGPLSGPIKRAVKNVTRARDYVQVRPYNAEGSGTAQHGPLLAIDRNTESYWSDGQAWTDSRRSYTTEPDLTITFEKETDLDRIGIYSGAGDFDFESQPRPRALRLEFSGERYGASPQVQRIRRLADKPSEQQFDLDAKYPVRTVRVFIEDVFLGLGDKARNTSLASFEFFDKR
jgi:hypothetical protein